MKRLAILGSTGSIGQQTLEVVRAYPHRFQVVALAAGKNADLLTKQVREFHPKLISLEEPTQAEAFQLMEESGGEVATLKEMATYPEVDMVVLATLGKVGLAPCLAALAAGKTVALANKEVLVMAGELVTQEASRGKATLIPIDSEHSALWQCLRGESKEEISRILLTASGGAFRDWPQDKLALVAVEEALQHPTWQMGKKVTIDSATLMNKGMEAIEAHWFFDVPLERVEVIMHRESIVHSLVEFVDSSVKAQLSLPDMRLPIQYALSYPERWPNRFQSSLDLSSLCSLSFKPPNWERYPCLRLALEAGRSGGTYPAVLCAADEVAVELFLAGSIRFLDIASIVARVMEEHQGVSHPSLEDVLAADAWARQRALSWGAR